MKQRKRPALPKADRVAVVLNGNARQVTDELVESFDQVVGTGDLFLSKSLGEARNIARHIVQSGYSVVLTGGGDGTFVQMVTTITREAMECGQEPPRFGLLKLGTGNSLAWALGAGTSRKGVFADLARLHRDSGHKDLRLIEVEDLLTPFAGAGFDALGLKHFHDVRAIMRHLPWVGKRATGAVSYAISIPALTIPELALRPRLRVRIVNRGAPAQELDQDGHPTGRYIEAGETLFDGDCIAALVSTIPYWGFGFRIFPFADDLPEDRFCLRVVAAHPLHIAAHMLSAWKGTYRNHNLHDFYAEDVVFEFSKPTAIEIGGDPGGMTESMRAHLHPNPVRVVDYKAQLDS
ncbi:MAG: diacylglycerol kinase family protein [Myxococcales bacterium]|nr:diacylglycerol kinase family protein [Myxococcales bacterium]MDH3483905.1 diacylglycerol kinase family protein [Myxococcales bacterium]